MKRILLLAQTRLLAQAWEVRIPSFVDCTGEAHSEWNDYRRLLLEAHSQGAYIDVLHRSLLEESARLAKKWAYKLPGGIEDLGEGSADFYHACHWQEESDYCLYGHVAALAYLAHQSSSPRVQQVLANQGLRLLSWAHCLDFMESSSWGVTVLDLWDLAGGPQYPQVFTTQNFMQWGSAAGGDLAKPAAGSATAMADSKQLWIFEIGLHKALSTEPVHMIKQSLPGFTVTHSNFIKAYEGRAEAATHPFPRWCSPDCEYQQDSTPYIFPVFEDMESSREGFHEVMRGMFEKPEVSRATMFLCTTPIYYCSFFAGLDRIILGYFGLPLLYMVPQQVWQPWLLEFAHLASSPRTVFLANNAVLAEQVAWQTAVSLRVARPVAAHLADLRYNPVREKEILVPEPRDACVLHCLLRAFTTSDYPFQFLSKADTDRTFATFVQFRGVVLYPHDLALMMFYEFYAMGIPMFLPSHLSKYIFKFSASVPLLDFVPAWVEQCKPGFTPLFSEHSGLPSSNISRPLQPCAERPTRSPLSLTTTLSLRQIAKYMDFFTFPGIQLFTSISSLLTLLPEADFRNMSLQMNENHRLRLAEAKELYQAIASLALKTSAAAASRS